LFIDALLRKPFLSPGDFMRYYRSVYLSLIASFCLLHHLPAAPLAHAHPISVALHASMRRAVVTPLSNGIEVRVGDVRERVLALRDDVLRVTIANAKPWPEDASWAVLPAARTSSVAVTVEDSTAHCGFRTRALAVEIDRKTLALTVRDLAGNILQQDARPIRFDGDAFRIYKTMPIDEHYFGLGDKTGPLDRRNEAFTMWNTDAYRFQESTDPIYKSIPYFMTFRAGRAVGVLLDNTWRTSFDFGKESGDMYSFGSVGGPADYYIFTGPTPKQVVQTYAWLTGTPPLPPLWSLGYQQSRYSYMSQDRVLEVAGRLRSDRIPVDAIYLDIDFQDRNRPFTVDRKAFPDPEGMIAKLKADNFHVVVITDLHIAKLPGQNYAPYDTGSAGDHFVRNPDGSVFTGRVWPGPSVFPDFMRQQTRAWWGTLYRDLRHTGVEGFWNDMNEPSVFDTPNHTLPENAVHRIDEPGFAARTATHAEVHAVYGMENSRATFDGLRVLDPDLRPFVLTRASFAGGQRYAATWTGDNSSSWSHLRMATPMLENLGLSGFAVSGADVGGYAGTPSPELLTKWFEIGAFQPIDRDHTEKGTGDQEPWVGGPQHEAIRRHFIETRYQLLPYLYTLAEEASRTGMPILRPLFLEFPDAAPDRHPLDTDNDASGEFLLGGNLLVAPPPYPGETGDYSVELPSPDWYDFWTGAHLTPVDAPPSLTADPAAASKLKTPPAVRITPRLAELPVFVRAGTILPVAPIVESSNESPRGPLTLRVYAGEQCSGQLYQDDGKTYAYTRGDFLRMQFSCQQGEDGLEVRIGAHQGSFPAWWKQIQLEVHGWTPKQGEIRVNGEKLVSHIDIELNSFAFVMQDDGKGALVSMK
jgi:alpha-glucosidase